VIEHTVPVGAESRRGFGAAQQRADHDRTRGGAAPIRAPSTVMSRV
jgi:hypothetical protein